MGFAIILLVLALQDPQVQMPPAAPLAPPAVSSAPAQIPAAPQGGMTIVTGPGGNVISRTGAPAIAAPLLPVDARRVVDQATLPMIEQLQSLQDFYLNAQRPEDAAAVRKQIQLLRQVTGLADDSAIRADKVSMTMYRDRVGETFEFTIAGSADFPVWGTSIYTDDTPLESAAVHAGVLRSGQVGPVRVTVLAGRQQYIGSKQNGIESGSYGSASGSFRVETGPGTASRPTSLTSLRGRFGETVVLPTVGATSGALWGSDVYTDDSSLGMAAVHAGILQPGEFGFVKVTLLGGQSRYTGSVKNGVMSQNFAEWQGSFRIEAAPPPWVIRVPEDVNDASGLVPLVTLRKQPGMSFSLKVTGSAGAVRGSDVYTDDSSIGAAAVHAGALRPGERGYVTVTIMPGQESYAGSEQNGVKSANAGAWGGSFMVTRSSVGR